MSLEDKIEPPKPEKSLNEIIELLKPKDIGTLEEKMFLTLLEESFNQIKNVIINKKPMHDLALKMAKPRFEKIHKYIKYSKDQEEYFKIEIPLVNEKDLEINKPSNPANKFKVDLQNYRPFPDTDCFIRCDSASINQALGLLTIEHKGYYTIRKFNDHKHEDTKIFYNEPSFFYFDFEKKKYIQAPTPEVLELRYKTSKNMEIDESKYHPNSIIFRNREKLLPEIEDRLKLISEEKRYRRDFHGFANTKCLTRTVENVKEYAAMYYSFLGILEDWLKLKMYLSKVTPLEFKVLLEERIVLMDICKEIQDADQYLDSHIDRLEAFQTGKPEDDKLQNYNALNGFIKYDSKNRILFPNIVEVERRRSRRLNDHYNDISYIEYLEKAMRILDKQELKKKQEEVHRDNKVI